ncbi:MAG: hypothetical protein WCH34_09370 [Bacteroidota bacterium]
MSNEIQPTKVDLLTFYQKTHNTWKEGKVIEFNPESKTIANANSLEEFIKRIEIYTGNSIQIIAEKIGFLEDEVLIFAIAKKLLLTNKRYFISDREEFEAYFLNKIKKVKRNGLFILIIVFKDGFELEFSFRGDYITMEGVEKAMKIVPSYVPNIPINNLDLKLIEKLQVAKKTNELTSKDVWECTTCGSFNPISSEKCSNIKCANKENSGSLFNVEKKRMKAGAIPGIIMMLFAVVWFFIGYNLGWVFFYPPILFIIGLIAFLRGVITGNFSGEKKNEK